MRKILAALIFVFYCFVSGHPLFAEDYRILYRSSQMEGAYPSVGLDPENGRFIASFYVRQSTTTAPLEEYDLEGNKLRDRDESHWREYGITTVPGKSLYVYTQLTICPKPLKEELCDYKPEGYMYDVIRSTFLYHSEKFVRNYPDFTYDGEYMLGKYGWGPDEGGEEYPSTGTCLFQVDTGKEIWCKEEQVSRHEAFLSEKGGIIAGDKAIYGFSTGEKIWTYPQYAEKGDTVVRTQRKGVAIVVRAMSPDGRYFVATEGKCDEDRVTRVGKTSGCNVAFLSDMETYLGEWNRGDIKRKIKVFDENYPDNNLKHFYFLPDGQLVVYGSYPPRIQLMNMDGETVSEINNDKASSISPLSMWRLQPWIDFKNKVVVWPSAEEKEVWRVYSVNGNLIGEFIWQEPQGRESHLRHFAMINDKEYIFTVDIVTKKRKSGGTLEYITEVYRGKFAPPEIGK